MPTKQARASETDQLDERQLLTTLMAVKKGDFSVRMPVDRSGVAGKIADTLNEVIELTERMTGSLSASTPSSARRARSASAPRSARPAGRGRRASTR